MNVASVMIIYLLDQLRVVNTILISWPTNGFPLLVAVEKDIACGRSYVSDHHNSWKETDSNHHPRRIGRSCKNPTEI
jgi:hypothetical protein